MTKLIIQSLTFAICSGIFSVYPKGKSHLELDKVIGLTKASVRYEKNGMTSSIIGIMVP